MLNFLVLEAATNAGGKNQFTSLILMVGMVAVMYFMVIRPQKKKQKEEQTMRDSIMVGDEITTIGGIMGRVVTVKDDSIVIETGADKVKMRFQKWAIQTNDTANARMEAERKAAADAKKAESEKKAIDEKVEGRGKKAKRVVKNVVEESPAVEVPAEENVAVETTEE